MDLQNIPAVKAKKSADINPKSVQPHNGTNNKTPDKFSFALFKSNSIL
jgi:hypothetical protein